MEIFRTIHGRPCCFTLTSHELMQAYEEKEHQYDLENVRNHLDGQYDEETLDAIAWEARRQMDKYDLSFDYAVDEAIIDLGLTKERA